ncbi:hypothetical protein GDO86_016518 [Hymenochirus boettgeri]|uniref:Uncharacterized protein n=1 Tax=Hymenochirus boettgeri TaxID=247094 RepID=A0A8T2JZV9_9PIPI|nr:hypothetical protein GDO86_016518 [Hymenochirus boettgeri]
MVSADLLLKENCTQALRKGGAKIRTVGHFTRADGQAEYYRFLPKNTGQGWDLFMGHHELAQHLVSL